MGNWDYDRKSHHSSGLGKAIMVFDLETIPAQGETARNIAKTLYPRTKDVQEKIDKTALDGSYGEIYCISVITDVSDEEAPITFSRGDINGVFNNGTYVFEKTEAQVLQEFNSYLETLSQTHEITWCGHNIVGFDLRFLWQRYLINGVKPFIKPPYDAKPWDTHIKDTMSMWSGFKNKIKMSNLAKILGIEHMDPIDGGGVLDAIKIGSPELVTNHCEIDVITTMKIYQRISGTHNTP